VLRTYFAEFGCPSFHVGSVGGVGARGENHPGTADETTALALGGCPTGQVITTVKFASFGTPGGSCATGFTVDKTCNAFSSVATVKAYCVGKASCTIQASPDVFGGDPCLDTRKHLSVQVGCGPASEVSAAASASTLHSGEEQPQERVLLAQANPLPPLPPTPPNGTWPQISGKVQTEHHVLRPGNTAPLETLFCWHGFQCV
jgi:hypothetical protein